MGSVGGGPASCEVPPVLRLSHEDSQLGSHPLGSSLACPSRVCATVPCRFPHCDIAARGFCPRDMSCPPCCLSACLFVIVLQTLILRRKEKWQKFIRL